MCPSKLWRFAWTTDDWMPMTPLPANRMWEASVPANGDHDRLSRHATPMAQPTKTRSNPPARNGRRRPRRADGSDQDRVGAWPEKLIFDTQLGPNRNGRHW